MQHPVPPQRPRRPSKPGTAAMRHTYLPVPTVGGYLLKKETTGIWWWVNPCSPENSRVGSSLRRVPSCATNIPVPTPASGSTVQALLLRLGFLGCFLLETEQSCLIETQGGICNRGFSSTKRPQAGGGSWMWRVRGGHQPHASPQQSHLDENYPFLAGLRGGGDEAKENLFRTGKPKAITGAAVGKAETTQPPEQSAETQTGGSHPAPPARVGCPGRGEEPGRG